MESTQHIQILTAAPSRDAGEAIGGMLVERRLAACVQVVGPIASTYRWQGAIERAEEWLCLIKTTRERFDAVADAIRAAHPYETPEIIATPIVAGDAAYLRWLDEQTRGEE
jgi:periplasmic divalent cation tolerance protein